MSSLLRLWVQDVASLHSRPLEGPHEKGPLKPLKPLKKASKGPTRSPEAPRLQPAVFITPSPLTELRFLLTKGLLGGGGGCFRGLQEFLGELVCSVFGALGVFRVLRTLGRSGFWALACRVGT